MKPIPILAAAILFVVASQLINQYQDRETRHRVEVLENVVHTLMWTNVPPTPHTVEQR